MQTQKFLLHLQAVWPRTPRKIGPYTLVRSLGQGSVGPAYLIEEPATLQPLVVKVLWPDLSDDPPTRQQFVQDAKAMQQLPHAGIAAVRAVRDGGRLCCVVSEFCPGISLAQWRRKNPQPIAWEIAAGLVLQLAGILDVAHRRGISHGNLKPSNLILVSDQEITVGNLHQAPVRVLDFALAKAVQQTRLASPGSLAWPMPQYLAPEQLRFRMNPSEPASDVYALAVMWYELLTGRCPVKGATRDEVLRTHARNRRPRRPDSIAPKSPPLWSRWCCAACTARRANGRRQPSIWARRCVRWCQARLRRKHNPRGGSSGWDGCEFF